MMRTFLDLPIEMISQILSFTLVDHNRPGDLLAVHSSFLAVALPLLHSQVSLRSFDNLERFTDKRHGANLSRIPTSLDIQLPGGQVNKRLWVVLRKVFQRCMPPHLAALDSPASSDDDETSSTTSSGSEDNLVYYGRQQLEHVRLSLNSLASDPSLKVLSKALAVLDPTSFSWSGPDPDHNFSCAIVPAATDQLFRGLTSWTNLSHLSLSAISFSRCRGRSLLSLSPQRHPNLKKVTIQRAVFILPGYVASCAIQCSETLEEFLLVDAYQESIWGPRVRKADVEQAVTSGQIEHDGAVDKSTALGLVRQLVRCEARTERLEGGDREVSVCS